MQLIRIELGLYVSIKVHNSINEYYNFLFSYRNKHMIFSADIRRLSIITAVQLAVNNTAVLAGISYVPKTASSGSSPHYW